MKLDINRWFVIGLTQLLYISILLSPYIPPVILLVVGISTFFLYKGKWVLKNSTERIFIGFVFLSLVSWFFNPSYFFSVPIGIISVSMFSLYYLLAVWIRGVVKWGWKDVQHTYFLFWLGGFYVVAIVFIQQLNWSFIKDSWLGSLLAFYNKHCWQEESIRSVGTTGNSNITAAMLICFALMSIYISSILRKKWQKVAVFLTFFVYCGAIAFTGSRGACIGLAIGLITQLWMTGHRKRTIIIILCIILLITFFPEIIPRNDTLASTVSDRFKVWSTSFEIFKENWVVGTLPVHFGQVFEDKVGSYHYHAHNVLLGIASEFGVCGLIMFLTLIIITIRRARKWRKIAGQKEERRLAGMLISQTIALLGHGMYDYPMISPQVGLIFMLSIIIINIQFEERCGRKIGLIKG